MSGVVATGLGAVSAAGIGRGALWEALATGLDGIRPIERFTIAGIPHMLGGLVPGYTAPRKGARAHRGLPIELGVIAAREAWQHAGLDRAAVPASRIALVVGTSIGDDLHDPTPLDEITRGIGDALGITGPRITVSTACTSSTNAIGLALELLATGTADVVLAGGSDVLTPEIYAGFHAIGVLSQAKCAPFSEPFGTTLGEGAGFLVLERDTAATERGAHALVTVCGYGLSADAFHETSPDPAGSGVARAITSALGHAGVTPDGIDYVNMHGTGTQANDPAETRAILRVFGERALPVSSTKALLGHAQGAAGVLELATTILGMREGVIPQTVHFTRARAHVATDPVGQATPRPGRITRAVKTSSAFGGANAALVIAQPGETPAPARPRRPVFVRGTGLVERDLALDEILPTVSLRGLNPSTRYLTGAAALALGDAGIRLRKTDQERAGIIAGAISVSPQTAAEFRASIDQRGFAQLSAAAFARMVLNAPAGATSKLLGLKGPGSTIDTADGSGLVAIAYAAQLLATRGDIDVLVAGGYDEIDPDDPPAIRERLTEGAACVVLATTGTLRVAGWGLAGPGDGEAAIARALATAAVAQPAARFDEPAGASPRALVSAVRALRAGEHTTCLVTSVHGTATTCALVLTTLESTDGC
jgi:3-oxoacyl-[acyl-carrier-protein] synthase II